MNKTLTPKQEAFAVAMADPSCANATEAYQRAGYSVAGSPESVHTRASAIANNAAVMRRIKELRESVATEALGEFGALQVLREWITIATADPAELMKLRLWCCRHCWGTDHHYQWISEDEYSRRYCEVMDWNATKPAKAHARSYPSFDGGVGYDRRREPHPNCPECGGEGHRDVLLTATDKLSPAGRKLFAGIKQTNTGIEIKTRDQDGALVNIAKYLGMLAERHRHGGDPDNPTPILSAAITADMTPQEAGKLYTLLMQQAATVKK